MPKDKDFIKLCGLLVVTGAFWVSTMVNANATQRYSTEDSCYYGVDTEQAMRKMPECLKAIQFNLDTMIIEIQYLIEQMRDASDNQKTNDFNQISHKGKKVSNSD